MCGQFAGPRSFCPRFLSGGTCPRLAKRETVIAMKLNLTTGLIVVGVILVTIKFRADIMAILDKVPVVGKLVA